MKMPKGDYYHQKFGGKNLKTYHARQTFWYILKNRAPITLKILKNEVLPIYIQLFSKDDSTLFNKLDLEGLFWKQLIKINMSSKNLLAPLIEAINKWSERFNLFDDWIKDKLLQTLADWRNIPPKEREKLSYYGIEKIVFGTNQPTNYSFETKDWNFSLETWGEAKKRITLDFKVSLDQYKKEKEDLARKSGLVKTRSKRNFYEQIRWLIDYQVYRKSTIDLANSISKRRLESIDPSTISRAIKRTAGLLGLRTREQNTKK